MPLALGAEAPDVGSTSEGGRELLSAKILHVQDHSLPKMSGYAFRSRYLVATQLALGLEARVVSSARHREFDDLEESYDGIHFYRTPWPDKAIDRFNLKIPFWRERTLTRALSERIIEVAQEFKPELLHAHSPMFNGLAASRAARSLGIPLVYEIRAFWEDDAVDKGKFSEGSFVYKQVRRLETKVCRAADRVVTICDGLKNDLVKRGIHPDKVIVVPNGVDGERFQPSTKDLALAKSLGMENSEVVGFIGSFFHYEGLPLLVDAVARLAATRPRLRLLLVGGGEDEDAVKRRVEELGIQDRVVMTGRVPHSEVAGYYGLMDLMIYPRISRRITELVTPLKPLEAQAMGIAVLGSSVGGIRELFDEGRCGRLFETASVDAMVDAIELYLDPPKEELEAEAERNRLRVLEERRWERVLAPEIKTYEELLAATPRASRNEPVESLV